MKYLINSLIVATIIALSACGGSTEPEQELPQPPANVDPVANAGDDFSVQENTIVSLNATTSSDPDGTISSFAWSQTSGNPMVTLNNSTTFNANFTAPDISAETQLTFEVTVTDDDGATNSDSVTITVIPVIVANQSPVAVVSDDFSVEENTSVTLDGSASNDPDGNITVYSWQQISGSATVVLNNSNTAIADFGSPDISADTSLTFQLTVTDDQGATNSSSMVVTLTDVSVTNPITAVIETSRTSCTAPCGIMFNASSTTATGVSEPFHQLHYSWHYDDIGSTFQEMPGINANQSSTSIGAHVYEQPGTYTVTLTVTDDNGATDTQTIDIVVNNPEVVYAAETYCVSNTARFSSCPNQNLNYHLVSFAAAVNILSNLRFNQAGRPTRILFRSGDTFTASNQITIRDTTSALQIGSFGSGNDPVISLGSLSNDEALFFIHDVSNITFNNITFLGNYDPSTGLGNHAIGIWFYLAVTDSLVYKNQFSGIDTAIYPHGGSNLTTGAPSQYQMIVDNNISNWQDYGIFGTFGYLSTLLGNSIRQSPTAISGTEGKCSSCTINFPDHGPLRAGYSDHLLIQHNSMFNNAGWSSSGLAHQPNIRLGTAGTSRKSIIADNFLEGGFTTISMTPANPGSSSAAVIADVIIERNQLIASSNTWQMIDMGIGGATIRNNLFLKPDNGAPSIGTGSFETPIVFKVADDRTTAESLALTNRIYNNTLISLAQASAPNVAMVEVENNFTKFEIFNNIAYLPSASGNAEGGILSWMYSGSLANVSMDNNLLFAPNTINYVWDNGVSMDLSSWQTSGNDLNSLLTDPLFSDATNFNAHLNSNSPAISAGKSIPGLQDDKDRKVRDNNVDIGAYEF